GLLPTTCLARVGGVPPESFEEVLLSTVLYHAGGPMILPGALKPEEADEVTPELINRAISVLRKTFRYIVVDLGITITDSTLALFDLTQHIVLVAAPELSALKSAADAIDILLQLGTPDDRLAVVLNNRTPKPAVSRAALERQVEAVAAGSGDRLPIDLEDGAFDVATVVAEVAWPLQPQSAALTRLVVALHRSGVADAVVAGLAEDDPLQLERCCRILGALRLEPAVPWLAPLLRSEHVAVSDRAARALGRIGGIRSAEALLAATRRAGTRRTLVVALARAAPDLFIETVLSSRRRPGLLGAAALAARLRRRHTAVGPLLALLDSGTRRHRAISCRALGWMRAGTAIP